MRLRLGGEGGQLFGKQLDSTGTNQQLLDFEAESKV